MVRSEEGNTTKTEAQLVSRSSCANEGSRELERKEKEIVRSLMIAERDKRESMITLEHIKKLNDQYQALIDDFYNGQDKEEVSFDLALPPTSDIMETKRRKSISSCENKSPNISPPATPPIMAHSLQENYAEILSNKDVELRRVTARAREESQRAALLAKKKEELQRRLLDEVNKWRGSIKEIKQGIDFKEKEIVRLSFLAEQDKKSCMFLSQQVAQLQKSLEGFLQAHEHSKPENLCKIMGRCLSSSDLLSSPPSSPLLHHTAHPTRHQSNSNMKTKRTPLGRELEASLREDEKKTIELARVKSIAEQEAKRLEALKTKVEELKQGLVMELQEADEQLEQKMQLFMQKQQAIEKVAARAERERNRSMFLKEEIIKLTNALGNGGTANKDATPKKKSRAPEYGPDMAYLSEFSELCDLENPSNHSSSLPLAIVRNLQTPSDPSQYVFSPPCRSIPISPASECIYMQKLKDIAVLNRETSKKDEELARLKKLAEAERCRHLLLKDKFEELQTEMLERQTRSGHTL